VGHERRVEPDGGVDDPVMDGRLRASSIRCLSSPSSARERSCSGDDSVPRWYRELEHIRREHGALHRMPEPNRFDAGPLSKRVITEHGGGWPRRVERAPQQTSLLGAVSLGASTRFYTENSAIPSNVGPADRKAGRRRALCDSRNKRGVRPAGQTPR
jgi:hypothetical protein